MIGRLVRSVDFERVLRSPAPAQSAHFAVHHLLEGPALVRKPHMRKLSTGTDPKQGRSVDDSRRTEQAALDSGFALLGKWLGTVVPKRHARRAATRSLFKRQIRAAAERHEGVLALGLWVVRLRAPFDHAQFPGAASDALKRAVRTELDAVLARTAERASKGALRAGR